MFLPAYAITARHCSHILGAHRADIGARNAEAVWETPRFLCREAGAIALILAAQMAGGTGRAVTIVGLALWALRSTRAAIQALMITVVVLYFNTELAPLTDTVIALRWAVLGCAAARVTFDVLMERRREVPAMRALATFVAVTVMLAVAVSSNLTLSLFKLTTFTAGASVALLAMAYERDNLSYWLHWFYTEQCVVLYLSVPLFFLPEGRHGGLYSGIFLHSQAFAVFVAPFTAFLVARLLLSGESRLDLIVAVVVGVFSIAAAGSRTGALAIVLGFLAMSATALFRRGVTRGISARSVLMRISIAAICLILLYALVPGAGTNVLAFAGKYHTDMHNGWAESIEAGFFGSRGLVLDRLFDTISEYPLTGVGFGLASLGVEQVVLVDESTGLPASAPVEQGFFPLALLAQVGIIGAIPFCWLLVVVLRPVVRYASAPLMVFCLVWFFTTFGEMVFFSTGGLGMQLWFGLAFCYQHCLSIKRQRLYAGRILA